VNPGRQPGTLPSIMEPELTLRPVTFDNLRAIIRLSDSLTKSQSNCVAPNAISVAQAHLAETAWMRAIYLGDEPIGFVMLDLDDDEVPEADRPAVGLWRFMLGHAWQRKGYGKQVLDQLVVHFADRGIRTMYTSCVMEEADGPYDFYMKYGFVDTGRVEHDEQILRLALPDGGPVPTRPLPAVPRVALITIWVDEMAPMRRFYCDALGFLVKDDHGRYVELENSGTRLALCERGVMGDHSEAFAKKPDGQRFELAFRCEEPEDVDEGYRILVERGATAVTAPQDMPWGQRAALFADPEGNIHEVFADLGE